MTAPGTATAPGLGWPDPDGVASSGLGWPAAGDDAPHDAPSTPTDPEVDA